MPKWLCRILCKKDDEFKPIVYSPPGEPEENCRILIELMTQDYEHVGNRTREQHELFGHFMTSVLLVEETLNKLLQSFDDDIREKTFGRKIDVFKEFLKRFDWDEPDLDRNTYQDMISPLKEIAGIRNKRAHKLEWVDLSFADLKQTHGYSNRIRPDLTRSYAETPDDQLKALAATLVFARIATEQFAHLRQSIA